MTNYLVFSLNFVFRKGKYKLIQGNIRDPNWYNEPTEDELNSSDSSFVKILVENLVRMMDWAFGHVSNDLARLLLTNHWLFKFYAKEEGFQTLLFDIENDPQEKNNIASEHPDVVEELLRIVRRYEKDIPECTPYWMVTRNWQDTFITGNMNLWNI